jgi:uncharacterized protein
MNQPLLKPTLYAETGTAAVPDRPALLGGRCRCGHVFFPMQVFGCEVCGRHGADLQPMALNGRGKLLSSTVVHLHADKSRAAPFSIGKVALDDGPVVRTLLVDPAAELAPGTEMVSALVPVETREDGTVLHDLRFAPAR